MGTAVNFLKKHIWFYSSLLAFAAVYDLPFLLRTFPGHRASISSSVLSLFFWLTFTLFFVRVIKILQPRLLNYSLCGGVLSAAAVALGTSLQEHSDIFWGRPEIYFTIIFAIPLFTALLAFLLYYLPEITRKISKPLFKWEISFQRFALSGWYFWAVLFFSFICCLLFLLTCLPGNLSSDAMDQYRQFVTGYFHDWHPLLTTMLLGGVVNIGELLWGSTIAGLVLYSILQILFISAIIALAGVILARVKTIRPLIQIIYILFYVLMPIPLTHSVAIVKDVLFSYLFFLLVLLLFLAVTQPKQFFKSTTFLFLLFCNLFLVISARHNAFYALLLFVPFLLIYFRIYLRKILIGLIGVFLLLYVYLFYWQDYLQISRMSQLPAITHYLPQQLSRVMRDRHSDLTPEERKQIVEYVPYYYVYNPHLTDTARHRFLVHVLRYPKIRFILFYLKIGLKFPAEFLNAVLENNSEFWYPDAQARRNIMYAFPPNKNIPDDYSWIFYIEELRFNTYSLLPRLWNWREKYQTGNIFEQIPGIELLQNMGFYAWGLFLFIILTLYYKRYDLLLPALPAFMLYLTLLASPDAENRYILPIVLCVPFFLTLSTAPDFYKSKKLLRDS